MKAVVIRQVYQDFLYQFNRLNESRKAWRDNGQGSTGPEVGLFLEFSMERKRENVSVIYYPLLLGITGGWEAPGRQLRGDGQSQVLGVCLHQPSGDRPRQESLIWVAMAILRELLHHWHQSVWVWRIALARHMLVKFNLKRESFKFKCSWGFEVWKAILLLSRSIWQTQQKYIHILRMGFGGSLSWKICKNAMNTGQCWWYSDICTYCQQLTWPFTLCWLSVTVTNA